MNGWCSAVKRPSVSLHSNIGGSTIHSAAWRPSGTRLKRRESSRRTSPSAVAATVGLSATISSRSPGLPDSACVTAASSASERNLAIGERQPPSSCTNAHTRPPAPKRRATSVSASRSLRGTSRAPALRPRTTPPEASADAKTLNSVPSSAAPRSDISRPKRTSGLSEP